MTPWIIAAFAGIVAAAGALGDLVNTVLVNNRSLLSEDHAKKLRIHKQTARDAAKLYLLNVTLGAVAACICWLAYGPYSTLYVVGKGGTAPEEYGIAAVALATAFFIGTGGTKWLQSERDKGRWQAAATDAARAEKDPELARNLSLASSEEAPLIAARAAESAAATYGAGSTPAGGKEGGTPVLTQITQDAEQQKGTL